MSFYAWSQDVPLDAAGYADVVANIGEQTMPGLVVHLAVENADGTMHYIDVWESKDEHDRAFETVVHPAVHPVLAARGIRPAGEPPRTPLKVVEVRLADGPVAVP